MTWNHKRIENEYYHSLNLFCAFEDKNTSSTLSQNKNLLLLNDAAFLQLTLFLIAMSFKPKIHFIL